MHILIRQNTCDPDIWRDVVDKNEYKIPTTLSPDTVVLDIGLHIGSFAHLVLSRGAGHVEGYEPVRESFDLAVHNLTPFSDKFTGFNFGVWRSDRKQSKLGLAVPATDFDTSSYSLISGNSDTFLPVVPLDPILVRLEHVHILKMDCEGSEFPILLTSKELGRVDRIYLEYHEYGGKFDKMVIDDEARIDGVTIFDDQALIKILHEQGFRTTTIRSRDDGRRGLLWATR
ncbi:FkbM family methyltransferase [bacterium]|nr:FkbM family methyltransferase [bacterium]